MDLFLAISQGIGTSLAAGVRAFLVPLLVGTLARANVGVDFEGTEYEFLESIVWLAIMLSLIVGAWLIERSDIPVSPATWAIAGAAIGGVLFAGSLAERDYMSEPGLLAGALAALIGFAAARVFLGGAEERLSARRRERCRHDAGPDRRCSGARRDRSRGAGRAERVPRGRVLRLGAGGSAPPRRPEVRRPPNTALTKLVLVLVDALKPAMLERAVADGRAPLFGEIMRRGHYCSDCVSVFPSVTPAAAASITTGTLPDEHGVPSICWYHRGEGRYVDYGSSSATVRTFGVLRTITDTVHNMNFDHLSRRTPTVFEQLEDAGVRTACTPFLIYRGRTRHEMGLQGWMRRVAQAANLRQAVYGPSELFYGELYASQDVDCQASLARPGTRDPYSGCVAAYIERYDLYDFLLLSLPDNDHFSHRHGPQATLASIERADGCLQQLVDAAGGPGAVPERSRRDPDVRPRPDRRDAPRPARGSAVRLARAPAQ